MSGDATEPRSEADADADAARGPRGVVVFRHGIGLNRWVMAPLERRLAALGYDVRNRTYPSTRHRIEWHGERLAEELRAIAAERNGGGASAPIHVVTHSMGGLVFRYAMTHFDVPPVARAVQIVPPNRGSAKARHWRGSRLYAWVFGREAGAQLAADPPGIYGECGQPTGVEVGIVGGVRDSFQIVPGKLEGPNDRIVTLEEMSFADWPMVVLPYGHTPILWAKRTAEEVASFLEHGRFTEGRAPS